MRELKAHRISKQIKKLYDELSRHQDKCKHNKATKKHDYYWTDFECPTCLKTWRVDGSH